ncbi:hypothetical protein GGX14DRAFT_578888 [Mycena pura]|uniref:Uncharacterized protein n=1 Tax=Mycena pura TaxID=153505 RepID=A0AAD6UNW2_9AGAR|nr:hypothetical protein GGX14DRAFT_578888 [Mycena pura]
MSMHPRDPTPHHVPAPETSFTSPRPRQVSELVIADHSTSPSAAKRSSPSRELKRPPKPRSRRCFVCGTTGMHPLDFRICPRTIVLLRRSLAKINDDGRLVLIDGSPLPMTRHPGGVAAHLISRCRNPAHFLPKPLNPSSAPVPCVPPRPAPRDRTASSPPTFISSSPHGFPPIDFVAPAPEHVPFRRTIPSFDKRARVSFLSVLLESMLNAAFRTQLRAILALVEGFNAENPATLRQRIEPVFERIYHFVPPT